MPAVSKQQRKFMGLVHAVQQGKVPASKVSKSARDAAKQMKKSDVGDFASTGEKGLPKKKNEADLGLTYKKGKTVKVKHNKSGKEIVIVDKPNVRKEYEKIGFFAEGEVDEAKSRAPAMYTQTFDKLLKKQTKGKLPTLKDLERVFGLMRKRYKELSIQGMTRENIYESVKEERDYKDEYKKFQSSTKSKKYRAELNKYNRKRGTYGNNDGKDASHKDGKIAGFEKESKNRGRAEKSRLKKENFISKIIDEVIDEYQLNEGTAQMSKVFDDLDKKFKKYNPGTIASFNKVSKYLKTKFGKGSGLPDVVTSFYSDYKRGGEPKAKVIKNLVKYAKDMKGYKKESVNESIGTKKYDGKDYFWPYDFRHYLRDATPKQRKLVHNAWLKIGVPVKKGKGGHTDWLEPKSNQMKNAWVAMKKVLDKGNPRTKDFKYKGTPAESVNEANIIQKIDKLAKSNKYGTVDGSRMNGKTAREIMAIFKHPKMNSYRNQMLKMKSHELVDLTISLLKPLKIKVESVNEKVIKVSKDDDIPGNPMKMSGEEKIKKLVYSGSIDNKGSYEIKGNKLNVIGIRPRDKGFFVRHFTMKTGFRKANLYYDGVHWQGKKKF